MRLVNWSRVFLVFFCIRPTAVLLITVLSLDLYAILNQHRNVQSSQVDPAILITFACVFN